MLLDDKQYLVEFDRATVFYQNGTYLAGLVSFNLIHFVAIADPTAYIDRESGLYRDVAARGTSVYFHGNVLPMLPEELSQDTCALSEGADRPALVCKIAISDSS